MWSLKNKFWSKTQAFLKKATPEMRYVDSCRKRMDDPHSCILIRANQYLALKMTKPPKIVFKTCNKIPLYLLLNFPHVEFEKYILEQNTSVSKKGHT